MSSVHSLTDLYAGSREQQVYETREKNRRIYNVYSLGVHFPYLFFIFFFFFYVNWKIKVLLREERVFLTSERKGQRVSQLGERVILRCSK